MCIPFFKNNWLIMLKKYIFLFVFISNLSYGMDVTITSKDTKTSFWFSPIAKAQAIWHTYTYNPTMNLKNFIEDDRYADVLLTTGLVGQYINEIVTINKSSALNDLKALKSRAKEVCNEHRSYAMSNGRYNLEKIFDGLFQASQAAGFGTWAYNYFVLMQNYGVTTSRLVAASVFCLLTYRALPNASLSLREGLYRKTISGHLIDKNRIIKQMLNRKISDLKNERNQASQPPLLSASLPQLDSQSTINNDE